MDIDEAVLSGEMETFEDAAAGWDGGWLWGP